MKKKRKTLQEIIKKEMGDQEFRFYFERERAISQIARLVRNARQSSEMTQKDLAQKVGTTQAVISRIESGNDSRIPSMDLLERIARAVKARLLVSFEYKKVA